MNATETNLEITAYSDGKKQTVRLSRDGDLLFLDSLDPSSASARKKFINAAKAKIDGLNCNKLEADLMKLAATTDDPSPGNLLLPEVDVRRSRSARTVPFTRCIRHYCAGDAGCGG